MIYIGIDTGTHTGVAVWHSVDKEFIELATLPLHRALQLVQSYALNSCGCPLMVIFEDAKQRKWIPREKSFSELKGRAQGAGSVKRDCSIWEEFLTDYNIPFRAVPPAKGATKWSPEKFKRLTGWTERTSNHARDAAMLVYGK